MKNVFIIILLFIYTQLLVAQNINTANSAPFNIVNTKGKYVGLSSGLLLKNNSVYNNPMYFLKGGAFAEINFGKRFNIFGIGGSLGYLNIKRDPAKWRTITLGNQQLYDSIATGLPKPVIPTGVLKTDDLNFTYFDENDSYKNFRGFYLMVGPEAWIKNKKLQANIYAQAGVGYSKFGYYDAEGLSQFTINPFSFNAGANTYIATNGNIADYWQAAITQKHVNRILSNTSGDPTRKVISDEEGKGDFHFIAKAGVSAEYFVTPKVSIHAGASIWYIGTPKLFGQKGADYEIRYNRTTPTPQTTLHTGTYSENFKTQALLFPSVNIGVKYWLWDKVAKKNKKSKKHCCDNCPDYGLAITAKDKYTQELIPNIDVVLKNEKGEVLKTRKTNDFGIAIFENIIASNYTVSGLLNNIALENTGIKKDELVCDKIIQKEILYTDRNFIVKGKIFECNSSKPLPNVPVVIGTTDLSYVNTTLSKEDGGFLLKLEEAGTYSLYAKKDKFFSQVEEINASNYNRDKNLFIKLEICAEQVDCNKSINLKNLLFDIDKYEIKPEAKKELNRLIRFMLDNPSVKVELSSHTDCRNTNAYNQTLSQNRANASVDYIVSQGIDRSRLIGVGYGETKLLNRCADGVNCSEAEHSINRRTEMKLICPENR